MWAGSDCWLKSDRIAHHVLPIMYCHPPQEAVLLDMHPAGGVGPGQGEQHTRQHLQSAGTPRLGCFDADSEPQWRTVVLTLNPGRCLNKSLLSPENDLKYLRTFTSTFPSQVHRSNAALAAPGNRAQSYPRLIFQYMTPFACTPDNRLRCKHSPKPHAALHLASNSASWHFNMQPILNTPYRSSKNLHLNYLP